MKGFATIMVAASVFLVAILLLSSTVSNYVSYNSNFSEMKTRISNYEIVMVQMAQDCDWEKSPIEINNCINTNLQNSKSILNIPYGSCSVQEYSSDKDTNTAKSKIFCQVEINLGEEGYFKLDLNKDTIVKKYN